jgi:ABC-type amino acid transport substrate-binding protein
MDENRIERALRQGPPDEPAYEATVARQLATQAKPTGETSDIIVGGVRRTHLRPRWQTAGGALQLAGTVAAAIALAVVVVGTFSFLRVAFAPGASPTPTAGDLLARLSAAGSVRIAVTDEAPQVIVAGGARIGFDVDVAQVLAQELTLRPEIVALRPEAIISGSSTWDLALPSRAIPPDAAGLSASRPYYSWPAWLFVPSDSQLSAVDDLAGEAVCVVTRSAGADWLAGRSPAAVDVIIEPPAGVRIIERPGDDDCLAVVASGEAAAAVTAALLDDELSGRAVRVLTSEPILLENRSVIVRGPASDTAALLDAVDRALAALSSSGRLAELSRGSFGGRDLTPVTR